MDLDYSTLSPVFDRLSRPAKRALINQGILTPGDLAAYSRAEVARLHGLGPSAFPVLAAALAAAGLAFRN